MSFEDFTKINNLYNYTTNFTNTEFNIKLPDEKKDRILIYCNKCDLPFPPNKLITLWVSTWHLDGDPEPEELTNISLCKNCCNKHLGTKIK